MSRLLSERPLKCRRGIQFRETTFRMRFFQCFVSSKRPAGAHRHARPIRRKRVAISDSTRGRTRAKGGRSHDQVDARSSCEAQKCFGRMGFADTCVERTRNVHVAGRIDRRRTRCSSTFRCVRASRTSLARPYTAVLIVPTGVGAAIGGYAGDALPVARALGGLVDRLVTHPNVLNGAMMYWPMDNAWYVEGHALDRFAAGDCGLRAVHQNRIGIVIDRAVEHELKLRHLQVADAAQATLGLDVAGYMVTEQYLGVTLEKTETGASTGTLSNPETLLNAAHVLVNSYGCEAIAVVARFPDDDLEGLEDYRDGVGVDALAGVEAVISHYIVSHLGVPCAHAPALPPLPLDIDLSPRSAAEELGYTFLPCVLAGLSRAPQLVPRHGEVHSNRSRLLKGMQPGQGFSFKELQDLKKGVHTADVPEEDEPAAPVGMPRSTSDIWANDVDAVIVPETACGSPAVLCLGKRKSEGNRPLLITVKENSTVMDVRATDLGLESLQVSNYMEALGAIAAHKSGVSPASLLRDSSRRTKELHFPPE